MAKAKVNNEELIRLARDGNLDAEEELLTYNNKLCYHIAQKYTNIDNLEELVSIGKIGLFKAYKTFDLSKGFKFATYASKLIVNEILMYNRRNTKHKNVTSIYESLYTDSDGNELTLEDVIIKEEDGFSKDDFIMLEQVLKEFSETSNERDKQILKMYFYDEFEQRIIADKLGVSQSYISRLLASIENKLKKIANKGEINVAKKKVGKEGMLYIFQNYGHLKFSVMANLAGVSYQCIIQHKSKYTKGDYDNVVPSLKSSIKEEFENYIKKQQQLNEIPEPKIQKAIEEYTESIKEINPPIFLEEPQFTNVPTEHNEIYEEINENKSIILNNKIEHASNSSDMATILYGIYQLINSMPANTNTKIKLEVEVHQE